MSQQTQTNDRQTPSVAGNGNSDQLQPSQDFVQYLKAYAREKPDVAALWCFGIGFVVGWKLKPW